MYRQSVAGEDHFVRALLVGNVATVAALCSRNEEALTTLERLAGEPVSFVHLGKLRRGPEWDGLRTNARFQKLITDAEAALNPRANKRRARLPSLIFFSPTSCHAVPSRHSEASAEASRRLIRVDLLFQKLLGPMAKRR